MTLDVFSRAGKRIKSAVASASRMNVKSVFVVGFVLLLLICFVDYLSPNRTLVSPYTKHIVFLILIFSSLVLSLNLVTGFIGNVSLGHAAFFGFGGYVSAILTLTFGWNFWLAFVAAGVGGAILAIPLGLPSLRTKGNFLLVITYGSCEVLRLIALNLNITGGPSGLPGLASPSIFAEFSSIGPSGKEAFIICAFLLAVVLALLTHRIEATRTGTAFAAIREDDIAAQAMGVNVGYYKMLALVLAGFFAGLAGSFYVHYTGYVSPEIMASSQSIMILTMVVFGGVRSIKGSFVGATVLVVVPELLHSLKDVLRLPIDPWMILYGLLLIVMMRVRPQGLFGDTSIFSKS
jgi:branched-chain amino acid transport system permease protein